MAGAKHGGLNTHSWATTFKKRENPHAHAYIYIIYTLPHLHLHTAHSAHICLYRQLDGDGGDDGGTPTAFR